MTIENHYVSLNLWKYEKSCSNTVAAVVIAAITAIATATGVFAILASAGVNVGYLNALSNFTITGGSVVFLIASPLLLIDLAWLVTRKPPIKKIVGEVRVAGDGNCVFNSVVFHLHERVTGELVAHERQQTVRWMEENYDSDLQLRRYLRNSMREHFEDDSIPELAEPELRQYFDRYIKEIARNKVYAGNSELYTLSMRHRKCFKLYRNNVQYGEPINRRFESEDNPAWHFIYTGIHYNPYITQPSG